jgi:putative FmdB family regulatory protein
MPTYEYACQKCGAVFELFQSMKDAPIEVCPKDRCAKARWGKGKVQRQVGTGAGLIFKGSGFYITDYRSEGYKAAAKKDSLNSSSSSSSSTSPSTPAKSDAASSKPAAPATTSPKPKPSAT